MRHAKAVCLPYNAKALLDGACVVLGQTSDECVDHDHATYPAAVSRFRPTYQAEEGGRTLLFDLGASYYDQTTGGFSQKWFFSSLSAHGAPVSAYYGWKLHRCPQRMSRRRFLKSCIRHITGTTSLLILVIIMATLSTLSRRLQHLRIMS